MPKYRPRVYFKRGIHDYTPDVAYGPYDAERLVRFIELKLSEHPKAEIRVTLVDENAPETPGNAPRN